MCNHSFIHIKFHFIMYLYIVLCDIHKYARLRVIKPVENQHAYQIF